MPLRQPDRRLATLLVVTAITGTVLGPVVLSPSGRSVAGTHAAAAGPPGTGHPGGTVIATRGLCQSWGAPVRQSELPVGVYDATVDRVVDGDHAVLLFEREAMRGQVVVPRDRLGGVDGGASLVVWVSRHDLGAWAQNDDSL